MIYMDKTGCLISDKGPNELHEFARKLGVQGEEFLAGCEKRGIPFPHYCLRSDWMRYKAVKYGAVPVSPGEMAALLRRQCPERISGTGQLSFQM